MLLFLNGSIPRPRILKGRMRLMLMLMLMLIPIIFCTSDCIPDLLYASRNSTLRCAFCLVFTDFLGHVVRVVSRSGHVANGAARAAIGGALFLVADEVGDTFGKNAVEPGPPAGGCYDDGGLYPNESDTG